ncbi:MAG: DUF4430 domain-containing protein [Candidatus Pacebacteria bacterium]|nr:DUF4430 domain-containing protein [Candidatus Paceibacterota bacterium]
MKSGSNKILLIIGLTTAVLGFGNSLINNGGLERILSKPKPEITNGEAAFIEVSPLPTASPTTETIIVETYSFEATVSGQTAFELLLGNVEKVEYTEYDFGTFVESINEIAGNNESFWAFHLNGEKAQAGADVTVLEEGDTVQFIYEKIEF